MHWKDAWKSAFMEFGVGFVELPLMYWMPMWFAASWGILLKVINLHICIYAESYA